MEMPNGGDSGIRQIFPTLLFGLIVATHCIQKVYASCRLWHTS
jgi:hypothetical protein